MLRILAASAIAIVVFLGSRPLPAYGAHGRVPPWVNESTDQMGKGCCGENDCIPVSYAQIIEKNSKTALVNVAGRIGLIYVHTLVRVCPQHTPQPFLCTYWSEVVHNEHLRCVLRNRDGSIADFRITPHCIRCLLLIECAEGILG